MKVVDFLDVTFDLGEGTFKPYCKPGNVPIYVHKNSNHPPSIIKKIPENVNHRISSISSNEKVFKNAIPIYQEALIKSGYDYKLEFDPNASEPKPKPKNPRAKRHVLWYNPPFNSVKVGYSTTPNILRLKVLV